MALPLFLTRDLRPLVTAAKAVLAFGLLMLAVLAVQTSEVDRRITERSLHETLARFSSVLASARDLTFLLSDNMYFQVNLSTRPLDPFLYTQASAMVASFVNSSPSVDSVVVVSNNRIVFSKWSRETYREPVSKVLGALRVSPRLEPLVRTVIKSDQQPAKVLTVARSLSGGGTDVDYASVVNLNLEDLLERLTSDHEDFRQGTQGFLVLGARGQVLLDSRWPVESPPEWASSLLYQTGERLSGTVDVRSPGNGSVPGRFLKSDDNGLTVVQWGTPTELAGLLISILILAGLLILVALGLLGLLLIQRRAATSDGQPLAILDSGSKPGDPSARELPPESLANCLLGADYDPSLVAAVLKAHGFTGEPDRRMVVVSAFFSADDSDRLRASAAEVPRALGSAYPAVAFPWDSRSLVALVEVGSAADLEFQRNWLSWSRAVASVPAEGPGIGVGSPAGTAADLALSFQESREHSQRRILVGPGIFGSAGAPAATPLVSLVQKTIDDLARATAQCDRGRAVAQAACLVALAAEFPSSQALEFLVEARKAVEGVQDRLDIGPGGTSRNGCFRELVDCCGSQEVQGWLLQTVDRVLATLYRVNRVTTSDLIVRALGMIEDHASDPLLSAGKIADQLAITPQYFSKVFNEALGTSFPEHLKAIRLDRACDLILAEEGRSLGTVARSVGFLNQTYFTTAFKARFGVTPGKYALFRRRQNPGPLAGPASPALNLARVPDLVSHAV